jgi:hypothetical protein
MILPAVDHWQKAGELSLMRSALAEACRHLGRAGELLSTLPSSRELAARALDVQIFLGQVTMSYRGSQAVETMVVFEKAQRLIDAAQADTSRRMAVLYGMWTGTVAHSELAATRGWAEQFLDLAEGQPHTGLKSVGHRLLGVALWLQGDLAAARQRLERAVALYDPDAHDSLGYRFGQNIGSRPPCASWESCWGSPGTPTKQENRSATPSPARGGRAISIRSSAPSSSAAAAVASS